MLHPVYTRPVSALPPSCLPPSAPAKPPLSRHWHLCMSHSTMPFSSIWVLDAFTVYIVRASSDVQHGCTRYASHRIIQPRTAAEHMEIKGSHDLPYRFLGDDRAGWML